MVVVDFGAGFTEKWHQRLYPAIEPTNPLLAQTGKVVFITGGGTGIGKAIGEAFVKAGAAGLVIVGRREAVLKSAVEELTKVGNGKTKVTYAVADIRNEAAINTAFTSAIADHGKIDVCVSNAAFYETGKPIADYGVEELYEGIEVNMKGLIITTLGFLKVSKPGATFINVSSAAAFFPHVPNCSAYASSKAPGVKFVEYLHHERPELRVFNLQPGQIITDIYIKTGFPPENTDSAELPGGFSVWLASPEAEFLRGRFLFANWDVDGLKARAEEIKTKNLLTYDLRGWDSGPSA
ncbi:hypothetical protein HYFRA_00008770 [Hymenoscyphus fraxineus]|uniref:NAD(P)-binding protein n=1 Tax=Hymenoscyphus fraxineus TaxID=746836 RepID=A0A9N9L2N4_9HELO|nr:hypothetical protein HYFRA_00008770 [Hymenoscyphus fraxineus]